MKILIMRTLLKEKVKKQFFDNDIFYKRRENNNGTTAPNNTVKQQEGRNKSRTLVTPSKGKTNGRGREQTNRTF